jgi:hypothetical protein
MKCPICKQEVIEDYCDHLILIYDESFQEIVYVNDDFSLDEFSSKSLDGDFISRLKRNISLLRILKRRRSGLF